MLRWSLVSPAPDTDLYVSISEQGVCEISFAATVPQPSGAKFEEIKVDDDPVMCEAKRQLALYFDGRLRTFHLPLDMRGTAFQKRVWDALRQIPYGETRSYADLALIVESPKGFRAVGAANGRNPIPIVVPCHRVIESNGGLGGFSCGLAYKRRLLDLESRHKLAGPSQQSLYA